jgi:hypothetical protein
MPFAIAMTLVVLLSSLVLLYQFWAGTLAEREDDAATPARLGALEPPQSHPYRIDNAA